LSPPTPLMLCVLALVLDDRPLRTGFDASAVGTSRGLDSRRLHHWLNRGLCRNRGREQSAGRRNHRPGAAGTSTSEETVAFGEIAIDLLRTGR